MTSPLLAVGYPKQARRSIKQDLYADGIGRKGPTAVAAIIGVLGFGAEDLEARYPSVRLLLDHGVMWVDLTRPRPLGKYVWNEDSGGSNGFLFLAGRLFLGDEYIGGAVASPGD